MKKMILAVPKGRILNELNPVMEKAGILVEKDFYNTDSRKLLFQTNFK